MKPVIQKRRSAVYTRKSSEEGLDQDFNSLQAQREACEAFVVSQRAEGWTLVHDRYDDGGYSGGTLERPALKRLMTDIAAGLIDVVVVYKIDRLSRSLLDFAKLVEVFDRHAVTFVSVTQSFNTTTSMGRLTLNVLLKGEVKSGFKPFTLDLSTINYPAPDDELWIRHLRTEQVDVVGLGRGSVDEQRLEDYVVSGLIDFDDIAYDEHADLLYDLAEQVVAHLRGYLSADDARKVLRLYQKEIARFVHTQMQKHFWQDADVDYEVVVTRGFTALRPSAYTAAAGEQPLDFRTSPADKSNMSKYLFGGFARCLYPVQKFQSDSERKLAIILEREALKWFKPAKGQFQIYYKWGADNPEYQPDFVAETKERIFMLEPKAANQMTDGEVLAKRDVAVRWCQQASTHARSHGGKPWIYVLIPHDAIAENMTIDGLAKHYAAAPAAIS